MLLVQPDFEVPKIFLTDNFKIRMLSPDDVVKDYDAIITSVDHLKGVFGPNSNWPSSDLTIEQDLIDLEWHQKEFYNRSSFTYTIMSLDESICLGCLYIYPALETEYDADVIMWVRKSAYEEGLDPILFNSVKKWMDEKWPFKNICYRGRD